MAGADISEKCNDLEIPIRQWFYRSTLFQAVVGFFSILLGRTRGIGMSHLLTYREDDAVGPLQRDEAIALFGIIRTTLVDGKSISRSSTPRMNWI